MRPVLIESMSYRVGHHSTSDDSSAYRDRADVESVKKLDNPHHRLRGYLNARGLYSDEREEELKARLKKEIVASYSKASQELRPPVSEMFGDVYAKEESTQAEQKAELSRLLDKWGKKYQPWVQELKKHAQGGDDLLPK